VTHSPTKVSYPVEKVLNVRLLPELAQIRVTKTPYLFQATNEPSNMSGNRASHDL